MNTFLITGATSGIGSATAAALAGPDRRLIITGRDASRGAQALGRLKAPRETVELVTADLSSVAGVEALAQDIKNRVNRLDVVVNNVGSLPQQRHETVDGFEHAWFVNHLAPYLLTERLRPLLAESDDARVIGLQTGGHRMAKIDFDNLQGETSFLSMSNYSNSKLAHLMVMSDWAADLASDGITVLNPDPGGAATDMTNAMEPSMVPWWMRPLFPLMAWSFGRTDPEESRRKAARSSVVAATDPSLAGQQGAYVNPKGKVVKPSRSSRDTSVRQRLHRLTRDHLDLAPISAPDLRG